MRPRLARVAGAGQVEVSASDTREIEVVIDPARLLAAGLTVHDVAEKLKAANELAPVGRYSSGGVQQLVLASGLWSSVEQIAETPVSVRPKASLRVQRRGTGVSRRSGSHRSHHRQRTRRRQRQRLAAGRGEHSRHRGGRPGGGGRARPCVARRSAHHQGLRPRRVRPRRDRQRARRDPDRRLSRGDHSAAVPSRLATDADRRDHTAARRADHVRGDAALRRVDQPDVDGRSRRRDWPGHRRRGRRRGRHSSPRAGGVDDGGCRRRNRSDQPGRQLDTDDRRGLRAARSAVGRRRAVLPRALAHAFGRCARLSRSCADVDSVAGTVGHQGGSGERTSRWPTG